MALSDYMGNYLAKIGLFLYNDNNVFHKYTLDMLIWMMKHSKQAGRYPRFMAIIDLYNNQADILILCLFRY